MSAAPASIPSPAAPRPQPVPALEAKLKKSPGRVGVLIFGVVLIIGVIYAGSHLLNDLSQVHSTSILPFLLLTLALLVALGFEFVNGFHDTANAVATVIYTHSLDPHIAVVWSGFWNFLGVVTSTGLVAFGIISLLPVELILQVGSKAGFAMVFALLVAAIIWNLSTWYFGLPASSSHTLIGSIIGVGIANQLMAARSGTSGVDWAQALNIGKSLLISPLVGFAVAALLLLVMKVVVKNRKLYQAPEGTQPPPFWIRMLLLLTCTGVSFAHGSNDGQKGMGLIMLILIGTVPTAYALNHAVTKKQSQDFIAVSQQAANTLSNYVSPNAVISDAREDVTAFVRTKEFTPNTMLALRQLVGEIGNETALFGELAKVPNDRVRNFRNDLYLVSEALRLMQKTHQPQISASDWQVLTNYKKHVDNATKFIPGWVKVAVAMALGLGTMVGWKRIVITVGEKIGKDHLTYGQGAAAEITAMATIGAADWFGLPVSTTHVLSSGIAGTMAANHSGLQWGTVRNLVMAWVLTLPASIVLAGFLFWAFKSTF
ncbi:MAG TPA: inorganic phosphate transporter [Terriglobales bacterium]|nr:inorganic phosphate transporter [Terriglobales bacterium]HXY13814.1 inorganic phosphate transporter [Terriglobales bacterium]